MRVAAGDGAPIPEPKWDRSRLPPAPSNSRLRTMASMYWDPIGFLTRARRELGPVFAIRLYPYEALICGADAATNQEILTDQERFVGGKAADLLTPVIGEHSLIVTSPPKHLPNRKLLLPPFHGEHVARWGERMRELVVAELDTLPEGEPVAIRPMAQRLALDVILQLVFGVTGPERLGRFRDALGALLDERLQPLLSVPRLHTLGGVFERRRGRVIDLIKEELELRRNGDPSDEERDDVLSILLDAKREDGSPGFTDDELLDELRGLVIAGHETTATAVAWTLHLLAHEQAIQSTLADSLKSGESDYLKAVISESMRVRPPVFDAVRTATADTDLGGRPVPRGSVVSALFTVTHRDPELWPDPDRFQPERHLEGSDQPSVPYALTPFGGGVRRCLGAALAQLEVEVAVREILNRARLEPAGPLEDTRLNAVTLVPSKGGRVLLRRHRPARAGARPESAQAAAAA